MPKQQPIFSTLLLKIHRKRKGDSWPLEENNEGQRQALITYFCVYEVLLRQYSREEKLPVVGHWEVGQKRVYPPLKTVWAMAMNAVRLMQIKDCPEAVTCSDPTPTILWHSIQKTELAEGFFQRSVSNRIHVVKEHPRNIEGLKSLSFFLIS